MNNDRLSTRYSALSTGKLPPDLLRELVLERTGARRPETLVRAALGIDAAAIAAEEDWAWVLTSDPITTATTDAGRLAVQVVCNDLAAMGAEPVGLLATLLFPAGIPAEQIANLAEQIHQTALEMNVEILGGHTEVAPGVQTPLVVMSGIGKVRRDCLVTAAGARPGDALVLTKAAGLEGTHVLASDLEARLIAHGLSPSVLQAARAYADELSVVPEARIAVGLGARAMHDPTEAGVVGALWEMAEASGCGFRVDVDAIPVRVPTRAICAALGVDPLRLIASGALLIACSDGTAMLRGLRAEGIQATEIGAMTEPDRGRLLVHQDGREVEITRLERDELYRIIEESARDR